MGKKGEGLLNQSRSFQKSEAFIVAALLALAGGFLDAYTYLCRGEVFANAQTGNMVLLAIYAAKCQWRMAAYYLIPILSFVCGVLVAEYIKNHRRGGGRFHWRHTVLAIEMTALAVASFIPRGEWNPAVNILVSFVCALQVETFRKVRGNPFASTMCTGNLRSGTEALYHGVSRCDGSLREKSRCYYGIIVCFAGGAVLGTALSGFFPQRALLVAAAFQLTAFFLMLERDGEINGK